MKILVVAPNTKLQNSSAETQEIINSTGAHALIGDVRLDDLFHQVSQSRYDYIHVISHGSQEGIEFSDKVVSPSAFAQIVALAKPKVIYLNTCYSVNTAIAIKETLKDVSIVTTVSDVGDEEAYYSGAIFAKTLYETDGNVDAAYEKSKRRNNVNYILLRGEDSALSYNTLMSEGKLVEVLLNIGSRIERYEYNMVAVTKEVTDIRQDIKVVKREIEKISGQQPATVPISWVIGYFLFVLSVLAMPASYDLFFFLTPGQKLFAAICFQISAMFFFIYGLGWIKLAR